MFFLLVFDIKKNVWLLRNKEKQGLYEAHRQPTQLVKKLLSNVWNPFNLMNKDKSTFLNTVKIKKIYQYVY